MSEKVLKGIKWHKILIELTLKARILKFSTRSTFDARDKINQNFWNFVLKGYEKL